MKAACKEIKQYSSLTRHFFEYDAGLCKIFYVGFP